MKTILRTLAVLAFILAPAAIDRHLAPLLEAALVSLLN